MRRPDEDIDYLHDLSARFQERANSFRRGYVKPWKATSIVFQVVDIVEIGNARLEMTRVQENVRDSLVMEGFTTYTTELLGTWLFIEIQAYLGRDSHLEREARRIKADNPRAERV